MSSVPSNVAQALKEGGKFRNRSLVGIWTSCNSSSCKDKKSIAYFVFVMSWPPYFATKLLGVFLPKGPSPDLEEVLFV